MRRWCLRHGFSAIACAYGVGLTLWIVTRALAGGAPEAGLRYTGTLTDAAGEAVSGRRSLQLQVWDRASAGTLRCSVGPSDQTLQAGRVNIELPAECSAAVHDTPDLWVEVSVDGTSLGRTKLGSVPYALEAQHAARASNADQASAASGALADRLAAIERTRVISLDHPDKPLRLCRGTTPIGGTDWQLVNASTMRVTVDISSCGFAVRPLIMSELSGAARHNRIVGGSNPAPPSGLPENQAFDIELYDSTQQADPVSANADQWHIAWVAIGD